MTIKKVVVRPQVTAWTRWTGDNLQELETHYGAEFIVDGSGGLERPSSHFADTSPVPEGYWFSDQTMGYTSDADFNAQYQEVPGAAPFNYDVTGS